MLAIAGGKGGSGKTTTALGLATALDGPVLVADTDRDMPNLHLLAGVDREPTLAAVPDAGVEAVSHPVPGVDGVSVVPAPRAAEDVAFDVSLSRLSAASVPTLLDCPAGAGPDAAGPLRVADGVLLVSPLCAPALRDAAKTAAMATALGTPVHGAVLTRCHTAPDGVEGLLDCPVLGTVPPADPPVLSDSAVRAAYGRLATQIERPKGLL